MRVTQQSDYMEELYELYPDLEKKFIYDTVEYGLAKLVEFARCNYEVGIGLPKTGCAMYCGSSNETTLLRSNLNKKLRARYRNKQLKRENTTVWYVPLTKELYTNKPEYLDNPTLYKLRDEAITHSKYVLRVHYETDNYIGWSIKTDKLKIK